MTIIDKLPFQFNKFYILLKLFMDIYTFIRYLSKPKVGRFCYVWIYDERFNTSPLRLKVFGWS